MSFSVIRRSLGRMGLTLGLAVLLALGGPAPAARAGEAGASWHVTQVSGSARLRHGLGDWQPVTLGAAVAPGTAIETGADARVVLASAKDVVTVAPGSRVAVPAAKVPGRGANFLQTLGTILFDIEHNPARHFEVDTPYLAAVVKGTAFSVTVRPDGGAVQVTRGAVQVASTLAPDITLVRPGQIVRVPAVRGGHMTLTNQGHTSIVPRTHKSKAELTEPDPAPVGQAQADTSTNRSSSAAAGPELHAAAPGPAAAAPVASGSVRASSGRAEGAAGTLTLDHAVSLPTSGESAGSPHGVVITRTLGPQTIDVVQATDGFVSAAAPATPAVAAVRAGQPNASASNGASQAEAHGANAQTTSASVETEAAAPAAADHATGNPGHGGTPASQAVGNPHVTISAVTTPEVASPEAATSPVTTPSNSSPMVTSPDAVVSNAPPTTPNPGQGGTPPGQAVGNPHVTAPAVSSPPVTSPVVASPAAATTPAIVVTDAAPGTPPVATPVPTPTVTTPAVTNPVVTTPAVATPVSTPSVTTPAVTPPAPSTPAVTPPAVATPPATPPGNSGGNGAAAVHGHGR